MSGPSDFEKMVRAKCARREMIEHLCSLHRLFRRITPEHAASVNRELTRLRRSLRQVENFITAENCVRFTHAVRGWNSDWHACDKMSVRWWIDQVEVMARGEAA